jgi:cation diffusion facilitator CzcD-associated flavoprotein CzcO
MSGMSNEADAAPDHDVIIVGAGFAGVYQLHRLRDLGFSVVVLEAGSELGGVWHWNCYPGARVDSHMPLYQFSHEELWRDWYWDERFPDRQALCRYFEHVDRTWDLSRDVRLDTRVESATWEEASSCWRVDSEGGLTLRSRFVVLCTGFAAKSYIPDFPGLGDFEGVCHHTAHWPQDGLDLAGRRVGVIGTGASGVQLTQEAAKVAEHLTVFQRTPILALPMQQRSLSREEQDVAKAGYPAIFRTRTETWGGFDYGTRRESALEVSAEARRAAFEEMWQQGGFSFWAANFVDILVDETANRTAYDFWRSKVHQRVDDPNVAELLAPSEPPHPFGVKRPSLEQTYYDVFNQSNVQLVDLTATPIERITASGVRTTAAQHDLDVLVMATGFDAVTGGLTSIDIHGRNDRTLKDEWAGGVHSHLGLASAGFPNLIYLYGPQSPSGFCNGPTCAEVQGEWVVELLVDLRDRRLRTIEATPQAEDAWRRQVQLIGDATLFPKADSWYMGANIPGKPRELLNYPGGVPKYAAICSECAADGYSGFTLGT